jgi:hypothetical protein
MRSKVKVASPEVALARVLEGFAQELIDATDHELIEAANDLGMNLQMKESAAYAGLIFPARWEPSDFFDVEAINRRIALDSRGPAISTRKKDSSRH